MKIAVVGAGNVGTTLAVLLKKAGHTITGVASRTETSAARAGRMLGVLYGTCPSDFTREADVIFLTVPDREIAVVCAALTAEDGFRPGSIVIHTSGGHCSDLLSGARAKGCLTLSFHPLQTFANPETGIKTCRGRLSPSKETNQPCQPPAGWLPTSPVNHWRFPRRLKHFTTLLPVWSATILSPWPASDYKCWKQLVLKRSKVYLLSGRLLTAP
ncbi:MAG: hypothetical protein DDT21_02168 [Syntrophomonadaceae bacterium]|nr:hypothetical protein [Bacillota bacterium]